jgi:hypothetical protein
MPRIRRKRLPRALMDHISRCILDRNISLDSLLEFSQWLDTEPIAPNGRWFKRFDSFTICGEGELVKTMLTADQAPTGTEME